MQALPAHWATGPFINYLVTQALTKFDNPTSVSALPYPFCRSLAPRVSLDREALLGPPLPSSQIG